MAGQHQAGRGPAPGRLPPGSGPRFEVTEIGHPEYVALLEGETAFWILAPRSQARDALFRDQLLKAYVEQEAALRADVETVRFRLLPAAVYLNPTERCNLNCTYCYLPADRRRQGVDLSGFRLLQTLEKLAAYFRKTLPPGVKPQVVFHGSEPLLVREAVFQAIESYGEHFRFGIQTNATLLDAEAISFLRSRGVSIGLSLDGASPEVADLCRRTWGGRGVFGQVLQALKKLADYPGLNVITTLTRKNLPHLPALVDFLHGLGVGNVLLNPVRGTQPGGRALMPDNETLAHHFFVALRRVAHLHQSTGHRLVVGNFANLLLAFLAPAARRLMCDISPCGGGRCFFAVAATGEVLPCSEFLGFPEFSGGNLFEKPLEEILESRPFQQVKTRVVENLEECRDCAVRHFCGAPCPAEVYALYGTLHRRPPYCSFYAAQARFALLLLAEGGWETFLWEDWQEGLRPLPIL